MSHHATNWAISQRGLKPAAKIVLWHLADCHNPAQGCFPSQEYLAEHCEMSRSTVNLHLKDLEDRGLIRRIQGRNAATAKQERTRYLLGFEAACAAAGETQDVVEPCPKTGHGNGPETVSENGDEPCPKNGESRVRNSDSNPVREPVSKTGNQRESAQARADEGVEGESDQGLDVVGEAGTVAEAIGKKPSRAEQEKRVLRLITGEGFTLGPWPKAADASLSWICGKFEELDSEEQRLAEVWRDAYLRDCAQRSDKPKPLGLFLKDRTWTMLDPAVLQRAEKAAAQGSQAAERPTPDDWAPAWGPVFNARLLAFLLEGRKDGGTGPVVTRFDIQAAFPDVWQMAQVAAQRHGIAMGPRWHALKDAMEPVPQDSQALDAWRDVFKAMGWPWLTGFDGRDVVYLPKGGPDGLAAFQERAHVERSEAQDERPQNNGEAA